MDLGMAIVLGMGMLSLAIVTLSVSLGLKARKAGLFYEDARRLIPVLLGLVTARINSPGGGILESLSDAARAVFAERSKADVADKDGP